MMEKSNRWQELEGEMRAPGVCLSVSLCNKADPDVITSSHGEELAQKGMVSSSGSVCRAF